MRGSDPDALAAELQRYAFEHDRMRWALARKAGMSIVDILALEHLDVDGPLTQRELGRRLSLPARHVHTLVNRLELAGWVRRRHDPDDRRHLLIELSKTNSDAMQAQFARYQMRIRDLAAGVPTVHQEAVLDFLTSALSVASQEAERADLTLQPSPDQA
jgi:DNA-binding MarR family transcriptional regulator